MTRRWPPLVIIAALLVGGLVVGRDEAPSRTEADRAADPATLLPVAAPADALDVTWFCAGQSAGDDTPADGTLVIANVGDEPATGVVEAIAAGTDSEPVFEAIEVAAHTTERVRVADLVTADWVAAQVQVRGGTVVVDHEVVGETGRSAAPCHSRGSDVWRLPAGASTRDATDTLLVYNPYPGEAQLDVSFQTEESLRQPSAFQGLSIGSGELMALDVSGVVTERAIVAPTVEVRRGQVVVDQVQTYDGGGAATTEEEAQAEGYYPREGLVLTPAVPEVRTVWMLPAGAKADFLHEQVVIANPSERDAQVELTVDLADPDRNGELEPFPLTVPAGEVSVFAVDEIESIPVDVTHTITVRSENGVPVVAQKELAAEGSEVDYTGVAVSTGSPAAATRWAFASGPEPDVEAGRVVVVNPGDEAVEVGLSFTGDGEVEPWLVTGEDPDDPEATSETFTLEPGARREVLFEDLRDGRTTLVVDSTGPVVAERRSFVSALLAGDDDEVPPGLTTAVGVPLPPGLSLLD